VQLNCCKSESGSKESEQKVVGFRMRIIFRLLLAISAVFSRCNSATVYVQSPGSGPCPVPSTDFCHSLNYYAQETSKYWNSNTEMIFLPGIHTLDGNLSLIIKDVTNVSMLSTNCSSPAVVNCSTNSGFVFESVVNLQIKCLVFVGCSKLSEIQECNNLYVALLFARCNNIQMSMVTVENSTGYGVCGKNNTGLIEVSHSMFQYNVGTETNHGGHIQLYYYNNCSCVNTTIHFTHSYFLSGSNNKSSSTASGLSLLVQCVQSTIST